MNSQEARELLQRAAEQNGTPIEIDADNSGAIDACSVWLAREKGTMIDLNKGLLVMGHVGTGKTMLMRTVRQAMRDAYGTQFGIKSCSDLVRDFSEQGYEGIEKWMTAPHVCFDDLGTENREAMHYGKRSNLMVEVIEARYERMLQGVKCWTHITTNLDADEIKKHYGERVASRIQHMMNILALGASLGAKDRRKRAAAPVHGSQINPDNIYEVVHPSVATRLQESIAPIVAKMKADRPIPMKVAHSAEADRERFAEACRGMDVGELEARRADYKKDYPMNTNGHSEAMKYVAIIDAELDRIRNTKEVVKQQANPAAA